MASGEVVQYSADVNERILEANVIFFQDEAADWKVAREELGEKMQARRIVRVLNNGGMHDIVWLWRQGVDLFTDEPYNFHQAVCKCVVNSKNPGDMTPMFNCEAWQQGVIQRAVEVRSEAASEHFDPIFERYHNLSAEVPERIYEAAKVQQKIDGLPAVDTAVDPISEAMLFYMRIDKKAPHYWPGNGYSGAFQLYPLAVLVGVGEDEIRTKARELFEEGWLEFEGSKSVRLAA